MIRCVIPKLDWMPCGAPCVYRGFGPRDPRGTSHVSSYGSSPSGKERMSGTIIGIHVYIRQEKHNSTLQRQTTAQHNNQNRSKFMQEGQLVCSHPGVLVRQELGPELNAGPKKKPVGTHLV